MSPHTRRPLILFVDDEPDVVDILARTFERQYDVLTALSAPAALDLLAHNPVDLVVTDQKMPEMTGIDLVTRARESGVDVTAILLTGYTDPADLIDAINKGQVYRYITKPWDVTEFMVTVKNALDHHFLRKERERLLLELKKRVDVLDILYELSRGGAALSSEEAIVSRVLQAMERVLPFDVGSALLVADTDAPSILQLDCPAEVGEAALLWVKDQTLSAFFASSGVLLGEERVVVRVTGARRAPPASPLGPEGSALTAQVQVDGRASGLLQLFSARKEAFTAEDARLVELLANQMAEAVRNLSATQGVERRRVMQMVECMADGVLLTDARNEVVVVNPAARGLLKIAAPEQATAKHLQDVLGFYPFDLVRGWEYGGTKTLREEVKIFDRTLHSTISPVIDDKHGTLEGVAVVLRDVSEQKLLEERKDEFVSIISHELRTPLTSISGALDLLLNHIAGEMNAKQVRYLTMAKESCERLNAIVDDLLDLSKFAKGKLRMAFDVVYLDELARAAVERYGAAAAKKRIEILAKVPSGAIKVLADPGRLTQVLNNLLSNALKFTPPGGRVEVDVFKPDDIDGFAALSCWNNGEPIAEGELERIFEKFEQGTSARTRAVRGTGLGLAICRSIVEGHGGHIWAESCEGDGARFVMVLPLEPSDEVQKGEAAQRPVLLPPERRKTVLVVDDEPDVAFILKSLLLSRGHKVIVAADGDEALHLARKHRPDLVIVDVRMPKLDGIGLTEILKHDPETRGAQILLMSCAEERERAFRQGVSGFLQKPIDVPRFFATTDGMLERRRGGKEGKVLVVDDDASIRAICVEVLTNLGCAVFEAASVQAARAGIREHRPDLLILDLVLPDGDGFSLMEELKAERAASHLSCIFISAKGDTPAKVRALKLGGDDYLVKPFDAQELAARVERVLRRKEAELGASPTTRLPGSAAIEREVLGRLSRNETFALCYLDLDNLKAYNDHYGYAKADAVVLQTGDLLRQSVASHGAPGDFIGHIAGDDFLFITEVARAESLCQEVVDAFDRLVPLYYDKGDREQGYIDAEDRYGQRRRFPVMSVSIAAVICDGRFEDHAELARAAADLKKRAKALPGSKVVRSDSEVVVHSRAKVVRARSEALEPPPKV